MSVHNSAGGGGMIEKGLWTLQRDENGKAVRLETVGALVLRPRTTGAGQKLQAQDNLGRLPVRLLASTESVNDYGFIVENGAFEASLEQYNENPILLAFHDMKQPIGKAPAKVTPIGLISEGFVSAGRPDIQTFVLDGTLSGVSVGFDVLEEIEGDDGVPRVTRLGLVEQSLVPAGANADAFVEAAIAAPEPEKKLEAIEPPDLGPVVEEVASAVARSTRVLWSRLARQRETMDELLRLPGGQSTEV